jgi:hypothetical protein
MAIRLDCQHYIGGDETTIEEDGPCPGLPRIGSVPDAVVASPPEDGPQGIVGFA